MLVFVMFDNCLTTRHAIYSVMQRGFFFYTPIFPYDAMRISTSI